MAKKTTATKPPKKRAARAGPRNAELEAMITAAAPGDPAPYLVYADWLQQAGEPRGELAAIQAAQLEARGAELARLMVAEQALLEAHAKHFYGPLLRFKAARRTQVGWFGGFVRAMDGAFNEAAAAAFLEHPSARLIQRLSMMEVDYPPPLLSHLRTASQQDLAWVWTLPRLRELRVTSWGKPTLGEPGHPELRLLHMHMPGDALLRGLGGAALPRLEKLSLTGLRPAQAGLLGPALERLPRVELTLGLDPGVDEGTYDGLGDISSRARTLVLDSVDGAALRGLSALDFSRVERLEVRSASGDVRNTMYGGGLLPELPALREVELAYPSDLVGYYRGFARCALAGRIERLCAVISKPGAGRALCEGRYERLVELELSFDPMSGAEYLQSARVLGSEAFLGVRALRLGPARHLSALAGTELGARIERLRVPVDRDRDAREVLEHVGKLAALRTLELEGERVLSAETLAALLTAAPEVRWLPRPFEAG
jgi:uncharacterized protein (TIGR02996 family)